MLSKHHGVMNEIDIWLVTFFNENEYQLSIVEQLQSNSKEIEEEIFVLIVKQDINVPPMKLQQNKQFAPNLAQDFSAFFSQLG